MKRRWVNCPWTRQHVAVHERELFRKKKWHYKEMCLLEQIKEHTCLKKCDKQDKFNLDMESKSFSVESKILKSKQGWEWLKKIVLWDEKRYISAYSLWYSILMISCNNSHLLALMMIWKVAQPIGNYEFLWFTFNQASAMFTHFQWADKMYIKKLSGHEWFGVMLLWREMAGGMVSEVN